MRLPQRWASSYNRVASLYIIPTKILSISMTVAMLGKSTNTIGQQRHKLAIVWKHASNAQSRGGAFQCILSIALVIKQ